MLRKTLAEIQNLIDSECFLSVPVLLDLGLPDFDGMEVIKKVREWSEAPIIVVSARDQDNEKASALDSGADDYLTKPFSATELMARIRVALRRKIEKSPAKPRYILTEIGVGYRLADE